MRLVLPLVLVSSIAMLNTGCCTTCGNCSFPWCSKKTCTDGSCAALPAPAKSSFAVTPAQSSPTVQQASHQSFSSPAPTTRTTTTVPATVRPTPSVPSFPMQMPEGEPSAMTVPAPPPGVSLTGPNSTLPPPSQIASQTRANAVVADSQATEGWSESPAEADTGIEIQTTAGTTTRTSSNWTTTAPSRSVNRNYDASSNWSN